MAKYSQSVSVTWNGVAFTEVVGLSWTFAGGSSKGRNVVWTDDAGTCSVECLGAANTSTDNYGKRAAISISGGGQTLTGFAVWESLSVASQVNDVTRYTVTLKFLDG